MFNWLPFTMPFFWFVKTFLKKDFLEATDQIAVRSKFIDESIVEAIEKKSIKQVVIIGAGLDARAVRMPIFQTTPSLRGYEIDFPGMLAEKHRLFASVGYGDFYKTKDSDFKDNKPRVTLVGTDLSQSPKTWQEDLLKAGFNKKVPTVWVTEGLTAYLEEPELKALFTAMTEFSAKGSEICSTWNGSTSKGRAWDQDIHRSFCDDPGKFYTPLKWSRMKLVSLGHALRDVGVTKINFPVDSPCYWLSLYVKD